MITLEKVALWGGGGCEVSRLQNLITWGRKREIIWKEKAVPDEEMQREKKKKKFQKNQILQTNSNSSIRGFSRLDPFGSWMHTAL